MSRFMLLEYSELNDGRVRAIYDEIQRELGFGIVPNLFKSMASSPAFLENQWRHFRTTVLEGQLPRTLKEMIGVAISQANQSEYALRVHLHSLSSLGISEQLLKLLVHNFTQCPLPKRQKLAIQFGVQAACNPQSLTDQDFQALQEEGISQAEIFELLATAHLFHGVNQYTDAIALEVDPL